MAYEVTEIKVVRKNFGLTQAELAKKSGVSQSLVAKIEAGKIDPSYSKVQQIFSFLETLKKEKEMKAKDIMKHSIISIEPSTKIKDAIAKMKKHGISQIPVVSAGRCVGIVSESGILNSLLHRKAERAEQIMDDSPPIVSGNTSINIVSELLSMIPAVLVAEKGKLKGIITKLDVLEKIK